MQEEKINQPSHTPPWRTPGPPARRPGAAGAYSHRAIGARGGLSESKRNSESSRKSHAPITSVWCLNLPRLIRAPRRVLMALAQRPGVKALMGMLAQVHWGGRVDTAEEKRQCGELLAKVTTALAHEWKDRVVAKGGGYAHTQFEFAQMVVRGNTQPGWPDGFGAVQAAAWLWLYYPMVILTHTHTHTRPHTQPTHTHTQVAWDPVAFRKSPSVRAYRVMAIRTYMRTSTHTQTPTHTVRGAAASQPASYS